MDDDASSTTTTPVGAALQRCAPDRGCLRPPTTNRSTTPATLTTTTKDSPRRRASPFPRVRGSAPSLPVLQSFVRTPSHGTYARAARAATRRAAQRSCARARYTDPPEPPRSATLTAVNLAVCCCRAVVLRATTAVPRRPARTRRVPPPHRRSCEKQPPAPHRSRAASQTDNTDDKTQKAEKQTEKSCVQLPCKIHETRCATTTLAAVSNDTKHTRTHARTRTTQQTQQAPAYCTARLSGTATRVVAVPDESRTTTAAVCELQPSLAGPSRTHGGGSGGRRTRESRPLRTTYDRPMMIRPPRLAAASAVPLARARGLRARSHRPFRARPERVTPHPWLLFSPALAEPRLSPSLSLRRAEGRHGRAFLVLFAWRPLTGVCRCGKAAKAES